MCVLCVVCVCVCLFLCLLVGLFLCLLVGLLVGHLHSSCVCPQRVRPCSSGPAPHALTHSIAKSTKEPTPGRHWHLKSIPATFFGIALLLTPQATP